MPLSQLSPEGNEEIEDDVMEISGSEWEASRQEDRWNQNMERHQEEMREVANIIKNEKRKARAIKHQGVSMARPHH